MDWRSILSLAEGWRAMVGMYRRMECLLQEADRLVYAVMLCDFGFDERLGWVEVRFASGGARDCLNWSFGPLSLLIRSRSSMSRCELSLRSNDMVAWQ